MNYDDLRARLSSFAYLACFAFALGLTLLSACGSESACVTTDRVFNDGDVWTCADGCNSCTCRNGSTVATTKATCTGKPSDKANKLSCKEGGKNHVHGSHWSCTASCGECSCEDGQLTRDLSSCKDDSDDSGSSK